MMKLIIALLFLVSCKSEVPQKPMKAASPHIVRAFQNTGNWDSVYLYSDGHLVVIEKEPVAKKRYFLISYQYALCEFNGIYSGSIWFSADNFPTKNEIDSIIFLDLPYKKSCYQPILISSIYEFQNEVDYSRFDHGQKTYKIIGMKKQTCE